MIIVVRNSHRIYQTVYTILKTISYFPIFHQKNLNMHSSVFGGRGAILNTINIRNVEQTCLFIREGSLKNLVKLVVFNDGPPIYSDLEVSWDSCNYKTSLGVLKTGEAVYSIHIPDIRDHTKVKFSICDSSGNVLSEMTIDWKPKRHWTIYLVQYSHHDLGYTDIPQNVLDEYIGFYDSIIEFCEETDNWPEDVKFKYQVEQLWSLLYYLRTQPKERVEKLLSLIRRGRIGVSALLGNEVSGLCGHEEIVRLLYPASKLKRVYGVPIEVAELNDVPGLSWGLATALSGSDVKVIAPLLPRWYYGRYIPFWDESKVSPERPPGFPTAFWWETLDGDRILFWYQDIGFAGSVGFNEDCDKVLENLPKLLDTLEEGDYPFDSVLVRLVAGHRDNSPPSLKQCTLAKEWNSKWAYPKIVISTLNDFFRQLRESYKHVLDRLPVFRGEIPDSDYPVGATSTMQATIVNRNAHELILSAEKFATIADLLLGLQYPWKDHIEKAYEHTILYDEHTWGLCCPFGPAQEASRVEKTIHAYKAYSLAHDVLVKSLNRIVDGVDLPEKGYYVVVFNSLPWKRTDIVRMQLLEPDPCGHPMFESKAGVLLSSPLIGRGFYHPPVELFERPLKIVDFETGREVICQKIIIADLKIPVPYAADRVGVGGYESRFMREIAFIAEDVPPLGYKVYKIEELKEEKPTQYKHGDVGDYVIENEFYRITVDPKCGVIVSLYDKELEKELVDVNAPHGFGQIIVRESNTLKQHHMEDIQVRRGLDGPVMKSIIVEGIAYGFPSIVEEIVLYNSIKRVDFNFRVLKDSTPLLELYIAFPFKIDRPHFTYEGPNVVVTPPRDQLPGSHTCYYPIQHWVDVYDEAGDFGVTWSSVDAHLVMLGGLWPVGVSFAHHGVTPPGYPSEELRVKEFEKGHIYSFVLENNFRTNFYMTQIGDLLVRYSLTSHRGGWRNGTAVRHGWGASNPLIPVFVEGGRGGPLPSKTCSFCEIDAPNIVVTTIKPSEDGEGIAVRLWETIGKETKVTIKLPHLRIEEAYLTNLVEERLKPIETAGNTVTLTMGPFEIETLKLKVKKRAFLIQPHDFLRNLA